MHFCELTAIREIIQFSNIWNHFICNLPILGQRTLVMLKNLLKEKKVRNENKTKEKESRFTPLAATPHTLWIMKESDNRWILTWDLFRAYLYYHLYILGSCLRMKAFLKESVFLWKMNMYSSIHSWECFWRTYPEYIHPKSFINIHEDWIHNT